MDTDKYRSTSVPIAVTLQSELEPVEANGTYARLDDGFAVEFSFGESEYSLVVRGGTPVLSVRGITEYTIDFGAPSAVELATPFGTVALEVEPKSFDIVESDGKLDIALRYALKNGAEITERDVKITARFCVSGEQK